MSYRNIDEAVADYRKQVIKKIRVEKVDAQSIIYFKGILIPNGVKRLLRKALKKRHRGKPGKVKFEPTDDYEAVSYETEKMIYSEGVLFSDKFVTNDEKLSTRLLDEIRAEGFHFIHTQPMLAEKIELPD